MDEVKVEIGPGKKRIGEEWINIGIGKKNIDRKFEWGFSQMPFEDDSVDVIFSNHVLEHVPWGKVPYALQEAYRVLKKNGKFEVHVPDFEYIIESYKKGEYNKKKYDDVMSWVNFVVFRYAKQNNFGDNHHSLFDFRYLKKMLLEVGFSDVLKGAPLRTRNHGLLNLSLTAIK